MRLQNQVALITGGNSGIGRAIALRFAQEGAGIIVSYLEHENEAREVVNAITQMGQRAIAFQADIRSEEAVQHMVDRTVAEFGRIDILVNNAGANLLLAQQHSPGVEDEDLFQMVLDTDLKGTFLCCRAVIPHMQKQNNGCIINMSWDMAILQGGNMGNTRIDTMYAAAKGAVHGLSMCLAQELAPLIRVNVLAPGLIHTALTSQFLDMNEQMLKLDTPMRRVGEPDDVAEAALYLASPDASYITGQTILINGGQMMY